MTISFHANLTSTAKIAQYPVVFDIIFTSDVWKNNF